VGTVAGSLVHGIATARMLAWSPTPGAFAVLGMVPGGILTALPAPLAMLVCF
jgi:putative effector of murein hydrolase